MIQQSFEILIDPRIEATPEDLQAQFDYLIEVRDKLSECHEAVIQIRSLREDLEYLSKKVEEHEAADNVKVLITEIEEKITVIENNIHETRNEARQDPLNFGIKLNNRLAYLATHESAGDFRPTDQGGAYKEEVSAQIDQELEDLAVFLGEKIPQLNEEVNQVGIGFIGLPEDKVIKP